MRIRLQKETEKKRRKTEFMCLAAMLLTGVLAACGAGGSESAASADLAVMETAAADGGFDGSVDYGEAVEAAAPRMMAAVAAGGAEAGGSVLAETSQEETASVAQGRKLIRNVDLDVETQEFDKLVSSIQEQVSQLGGYVENSSVSGSSLYDSDSSRYASICARVPSDRLDGFLQNVSAACNVTSRSERVEDVTLQYTDVESHKKSLEIEQQRLWELLEKAENVDSIIALEQRLSEIRYQLESYESRLRTYDNQVDYSTVNLYIEEVKVLTPVQPDSFGTRVVRGFEKNMERAGGFLEWLAVFALTSIPVLLVLAAIAGFVTLAVRVIRRFRKKQE